MSIRKKVLYFILGIYWLSLFILTSIPSKSLPSIKISDKINHFLAYFILSSLFYFAANLQVKYKKISSRPVIWTLIIVGAYAVLDELHQIFVPGRLCEFWDLVANFVGIFIGISFSYLVVGPLKLKKNFS